MIHRQRNNNELQAQTHHCLGAVGDDEQGGMCALEIRVCVACKLHGISRRMGRADPVPNIDSHSDPVNPISLFQRGVSHFILIS